MLDWKIIATVVIVLAVLGFFVSSSPAVSGFFLQVGSRIGLFGLSLGIDWSEKGNNDFSLTLYDYDKLQFDAVKSAISIKGSADASVDRGQIVLTDPKISGFSGSGIIQKSGISLRGSVQAITSGGSLLTGTLIELQSSPESFEVGSASINEVNYNSARGELILNGTITKFDGQILIKSITASIVQDQDGLHLDGRAKSISVPGAGIRIG